jgi:hypothetical protein
MLFELIKTKSGFTPSDKGMIAQSPSDLGLLEKDLENWLANKPWLLLPNEELLVIARSVAGQSMADVLALDALGRLVIVEIKRHLSDRTVVGQLLEYAARLRNASFEELQDHARRYKNEADFDLYAAFQKFAEGLKLTREEVGRDHRVFIVAPESDANLRSIVDWLKFYKVPIEFVPFTIYGDIQGGPRFLQLEGVVTSPEPIHHDDSWAGHWIFNTNEKNNPGAYERMFERNVAAIWGYPNGPANLEGAATGDKVFAYVNQQGLRAIGNVQDPQVRAGTGIFLDDEGKQEPDEYHLKVEWQVVPADRAITSSDAATQYGYKLPVRSVFAKLHRGSLALQLESELRSRSKA